MGKTYVITILGKDRPGLVAAVTGILKNEGANIVDIDQSVMRGLFAAFIIVDYGRMKLPEAGSVNRKLKEKADELGIHIEIEEYGGLIEESTGKKEKNNISLTIVGKDKPGIVYEFSQLFFEMNINIERIRMIARGDVIAMEFIIDAAGVEKGKLRDLLNALSGELELNTIFQPEDALWGRKLVVFDVDGTLIDGEIVNDIAKHIGIEKEVQEITERAMNGEIEFKKALGERVGLLNGIDVSVLERIAGNMKIVEGADELILVLKELGYKIALISGGFTFFTNKLKERFGIDYAFGNELEVKDGKLTGRIIGNIIDAKAKRDIMLSIAEKEGIPKEHIIAIGDGANDMFMIDDAGLGIAFNPKEILKKHADGVISKDNIKGILYALGDYRKKIGSKKI